MSIFIILCILLVIAWLVAFIALHVTGALIHLLLLFAVISLIIHFARGGRQRTV